MGSDSLRRVAAPFPPWVAMLPLVVAAAGRGFWAPDEPRYAQVARDAIENGHWLVLQRCGELYPDKPPLVFWLAGLAGQLTGWNEFAMRVPSLVAAIALAYATAAFARRWWGQAEAGWAGIVLLGMVLVAELGGRLQLDPILAACTSIALLLCAGARMSPGRMPLGRMVLAGAMAGLAALAKGPVAWVVVALPLIAWHVLSHFEYRRSAEPAALRPRTPWTGIAVGVAAAVAPVLAWALAACAVEPELTRHLFWGQHVERAIRGVQHPGPVWQHGVRLFLLTLPWTPLVVLGIVSAVRAARRIGHGPDQDPGLVRAGLWFATLFVFFSIIPVKRDLYLLPLYPALALMAARVLVIRLRDGALPAAIVGVWIAVFAVAALALLAFPWYSQAVAVDGLEAPVLGLAVLCTGAALWLSVRRGSAWSAVRTVALSWLIVLTVIAAGILPRIDEHKSPRWLAETIASLPQRPAAIPCYGVQPEGYRFYTARPFIAGDTGELADARWADRIAREEKQFLALLTRKLWDKFGAEQRHGLVELVARQVGGREVVVVGKAVSAEVRVIPPPSPRADAR